MRAALVALCLLLAACFPMPHEEALTPLVQGKLVLGNKPVAGVAVRAVPLPADRPCEEDYAEGRTDATGAFVLKPVQHTRLFLHPMAHRVFEWNLCVQREGGWEVVNTSSDYTLGDTEPYWISEITCDLSRRVGACKEERNLDVTKKEVEALFKQAGEQRPKSAPKGGDSR